MRSFDSILTIHQQWQVLRVVPSTTKRYRVAIWKFRKAWLTALNNVKLQSQTSLDLLSEAEVFCSGHKYWTLNSKQAV